MRSADETLCGLDMHGVMREFSVPGCSVAILDRGEIVEERALGVRSSAGASDGSAAVTPRTSGPLGELSGSVGAYASDSGLRVELSNAHGGMVLSVGGQPPVRLFAISPTELIAEALNVVVRLGAESLTLKQAGGSVVCARVRD